MKHRFRDLKKTLERALKAAEEQDAGNAWLEIREAQRVLEGERYEIDSIALDAFLKLNRERAVDLANQLVEEMPMAPLAHCIVEALRRLMLEEMG